MSKSHARPGLLTAAFRTTKRRLITVITLVAVVALGSVGVSLAARTGSNRAAAGTETASSSATRSATPTPTLSKKPTKKPSKKPTKTAKPTPKVTPHHTTAAPPPSSSAAPPPSSSAPAPPAAPPASGSSPLSAGAATGLAQHGGNLWLRSGSASNMHVTGSLYISGNNITVDNVEVDGTVFINATPSGGLSNPVPSNIMLHRVTATNMFSNGFRGLTLDSVQLVNTSNGPHAQLFNYSQDGVTYPAVNLVIRNSWFHGLEPSTNDAHSENLHLGGVQGALITNNEFDMIAPNANTMQYITANITLEPAMYGVFNSNIVFSNNVVRGGGYYQLYFDAAGSNAVQNNRFYASGNSRLAGVQYPPSSYPSNQLPNGRYVPFTQSGNALDGHGLVLPG